jgi:hypothetical protein
VTGDPLFQQVYSSTASQYSWYGEEDNIDKAFSSIVESFAKREKLVELYDFLRDTNQEGKARRLEEQYKLGDKLKTLYIQRVKEAATAYKASTEGQLKASVPYFAQVCKLAELYDREGNWDEAQKVYEGYCADFPDELPLLQTLGEVAQARQKMDEAIQWEKKVLECKARLATKAREWNQRELALTPSRPQPLAAGRSDAWSWSMRWGGGGGRYSYYAQSSKQGQLERWPTWMRLAQLYLAENNAFAAGDAMQRGVAEATAQRDMVVRQASELIQQRHLTAKMLPVLRTLAVYAPGDERLQIAFADSLEAAGRKELAAEVCNRLLRRGQAARRHPESGQCRPGNDGGFPRGRCRRQSGEPQDPPATRQGVLLLARRGQGVESADRNRQGSPAPGRHPRDARRGLHPPGRQRQTHRSPQGPDRTDDGRTGATQGPLAPRG